MAHCCTPCFCFVQPCLETRAIRDRFQQSQAAVSTLFAAQVEKTGMSSARLHLDVGSRHRAEEAVENGPSWCILGGSGGLFSRQAPFEEGQWFRVSESLP